MSEDGLVDLNHLRTLLKETSKPTLISVMWANNETGAIQPIEEITASRQMSVQWFTSMAFGTRKIPIDFSNSGIDMLSVSAHKIGGPTGWG